MIKAVNSRGFKLPCMLVALVYICFLCVSVNSSRVEHLKKLNDIKETKKKFKENIYLINEVKENNQKYIKENKESIDLKEDNVLIVLNNISNENNMKILSINFKQEKHDYMVDLNIEGESNYLLNFLYSLNNSYKNILISDIDVHYNDNIADTSLLLKVKDI